MPQGVKRNNLEESIKNKLLGHQSETASVERVEDVMLESCLDLSGNYVNDDCLEDCKKGYFNATVTLLSQITDDNDPNKDIGKLSERKDVSGEYLVTNYDNESKGFTVEIPYKIII